MEPQPYTRNVICMSSSIVFQWDSTYTCKNQCLQGRALTEHKSSDWGVPCSELSTASVMQMRFAGWPISSDGFCTSGAPVAAFLRLASPWWKRTPLPSHKFPREGKAPRWGCSPSGPGLHVPASPPVTAAGVTREPRVGGSHGEAPGGQRLGSRGRAQSPRAPAGAAPHLAAPPAALRGGREGGRAVKPRLFEPAACRVAQSFITAASAGGWGWGGGRGAAATAARGSRGPRGLPAPRRGERGRGKEGGRERGEGGSR